MVIKKIIIAWLILPVLCLLCIGVIHEQVMRLGIQKRYPPKGRMVDVGNLRLHTIVKGNKSLLPTVVFVSGCYPTGASSLLWSEIQKEVSKYTRTLSYDRAGILWSDSQENEPTTETYLENLYHLLREIDTKETYILVGHSISGMAVRTFAAKHPELVDGLVLIDSSHPEELERIPKEILGPQKRHNYPLISFLASISYFRLTTPYRYPGTHMTDSINTISNALFPQKVNAVLKDKALRSKWRALAAEHSYFGELPVKIIAASGEKVINQFSDREQGEQFNRIWGSLQRDLLTLSSQSELVLAMESGHFIPLEQPELVISTIVNLLNQINVEPIDMR